MMARMLGYPPYIEEYASEADRKKFEKAGKSD